MVEPATPEPFPGPADPDVLASGNAEEAEKGKELRAWLRAHAP